MVEENQEKNLQIHKNEKLVLNDRLSLVFVNHPHTMVDYVKNKRSIHTTIQDSDAVVLEYFPNVDMDGAFAAAISKDTKDYFERIAWIAGKYNKDIYVLDPAHDITFYGVTLTPPLVAGPAISAGLDLRHNADKQENMTRRKFIKGLGTTAAIAGAGLGSGVFMRAFEGILQKPVSTPLNHQDFRRIIIAKGLMNLSNGPKREMAVFYPSVHAEGIRNYLEDEKRSESFFDIVKPLRQVDSLRRSMFTIRKYGIDEGGQWKLKATSDII